MTRDISTQTNKIDQSAFIRDLVIEEKLIKCNANVIPIKARSAIKMTDSNDYNETNLQKYLYLIVKLMYLAYGTRSDIVFAVRQLSRHNTNPKKNHLQAVKRVVRYLKGTMQIGLVFGQRSENQSPYTLTGYGNSNFAGDLEDHKLVMSYYFFLNEAIFSWCSSKQRTVLNFMTEAKYIALGHTARETVWIHRIVNKMGLKVKNIVFHCNNET